MTRRWMLLSLFLSVMCAQFATPQSKYQGVITGRIIVEDGRPAAGIEVYARRIGIKRREAQTSISNEEGNFRFTDLPPGIYVIDARMPGYIMDKASPVRFYRIGEQATLRLTKGGVITGRVSDETGEPLVGIYVSPSYARKAETKSPDLMLSRTESSTPSYEGGLT